MIPGSTVKAALVRDSDFGFRPSSGLRHLDFGFLLYVFLLRPFYVFTRIPKLPLSCDTLGSAMMKILIADDDVRMRQMVKQVVAGLASTVYEACDGGEAIAVCAAERPDWVLMDFRMKPLDGLRATAEIKARFPETRIVIVSQYDDAELRAEAARVGACAYVLKENLHELPGILTGDCAGNNRRKVPRLFEDAGARNGKPE